MAVTFDAAFEEHSAAQTSPFSFTSGSASNPGSVGANSNRILIAMAGFSSPGSVSAPAMTWDGVSMTQIGTQSSGSVGEIYVFGLIGPATGSKVLAVSWTGTATDVSLGAVSVFNADQSTGWQNTGSDTATGTSASSTVTSANGNMAVVGHTNANASSTTINTGTSAYVETALNGNYALGYSASSGASTVVAWTLGSSVEWHNFKLDVIAASGDVLMPQACF